jgi:hypothetical protein|tara:strand:+ start:482 stop:1126 length:645 start_codon:yes stop_codon:yes gene_type:complete
MAEDSTNWRQWRVKTNLGTLASIIVAVVLVVWQGGQIKAQIESNSMAVDSMAASVMELSATVGLTIELDQRTNQLFGEIDGLRDQYQDQADVWLEIATQSERFDLARTDLSDLEWRVDDLDRRVAEAWGVAIADGGEDYGWQITDLVRQVAELQGRMNSGTDYGWQIDDLSWRVDDTQNQINALFDTETEMWDMMWRMWTALDSRQWTADYLHD